MDIAGFHDCRKELEHASRFANGRLTATRTGIHQVDVGASAAADLRAA